MITSNTCQKVVIVSVFILMFMLVFGIVYLSTHINVNADEVMAEDECEMAVLKSVHPGIKEGDDEVTLIFEIDEEEIQITPKEEWETVMSFISNLEGHMVRLCKKDGRYVVELPPDLINI